MKANDNKWDFKSLCFNSSGMTELVDLSPAQQARIGEYVGALEVAAKSTVANPSFSKYFVKESVGLVGGEMLPAGNIEYGLCQALHGEELAVSTFRSRFGRNCEKDMVLGIVAGSPGNIATPCGNCRDIMLEDFGTDFEIVSGAADGGTATVVNMSQYLFSEFKRMDVADIPESVLKKIGSAIWQGNILINDAYSPKLVHPERRYNALISTPRSDYVGARDVMCEYHPIYALRDAIRQARRASDPFVQSVIIVCEDFGGGAPHVMYKDRQHLLELSLQAELLDEQENNPPVFLATYTEKDGVVSVWRTSVKEWLPLAFSPRNFGPEFVAYLAEYFRGLGCK